MYIFMFMGTFYEFRTVMLIFIISFQDKINTLYIFCTAFDGWSKAPYFVNEQTKEAPYPFNKLLMNLILSALCIACVYFRTCKYMTYYCIMILQ